MDQHGGQNEHTKLSMSQARVAASTRSHKDRRRFRLLASATIASVPRTPSKSWGIVPSRTRPQAALAWMMHAVPARRRSTEPRPNNRSDSSATLVGNATCEGSTSATSRGADKIETSEAEGKPWSTETESCPREANGKGGRNPFRGSHSSNPKLFQLGQGFKDSVGKRGTESQQALGQTGQGGD